MFPESQKHVEFEKALDVSGFGKYNITLLVSCNFLILSMMIDIFGFSVIVPAVACDMQLSSAQQGLLSALPLIGIMLCSYFWGLSADTLGRRKTLLIAMPIGIILNIASSFAPSYTVLAVIKVLSGAFYSSASTAGFVLLGECTPLRHRSRFMFLMASTTMLSQLVISMIALPVYQMSFRIDIPFLSLQYRPWRLLILMLSLPGIIGMFFMMFLVESPKFLLSKEKIDEALKSLTKMSRWNNGSKHEFDVTSIYLEETMIKVAISKKETSFLRKMWVQTAPLFKPPLLKNSLMLYYILLGCYMTSTGYTMWAPTIVNEFFNYGNTSGLSFCEVASKAVVSRHNTTTIDCDRVVTPFALYATMVFSGACGVLNVLLSFVVGPLGKRRTTLLVVTVSTCCGVGLLFVRSVYLSIPFFFMFLYVTIILGNINSYLVELNPTHLRGMATCLSVVVARGFSFISVQVIASLMADYCTPLVSGYVILVGSTLFVAYFLPQDKVVKNEHEKDIGGDIKMQK